MEGGSEVRCVSYRRWRAGQVPVRDVAAAVPKGVAQSRLLERRARA